MDMMHLRSLKQRVRLGCTQEERAFPQMVTLDIRLGLDFSALRNSDDINLTVDYVAVLEQVSHLCREQEWVLVETMSGQIADLILNQFALVKQVEVGVTKQVSELLDGVTVTVCRDR